MAGKSNHTEKDPFHLWDEQNALSRSVLFHYQEISIPFEKALIDYIYMQEKEFLVELDSFPQRGHVLSEPNFLNIKFEDLFNIPVDASHQDPYQISQLDRESGVSSIGVIIRIQSALNINPLQSLSELPIPPFTFNVPVVTSIPSDNLQLPPPVSSSQSTLPSTPTIIVNSAFTGGLNTEVLLNTQSSVQFGGNVFTLGASPGVINAFFTPPARSGSIENRSTPGEILLTTPEGNTFTFYTANVAGHFAGDFSYVLNHAILTPPQAFTFVGSNKIFTDQFSYSVTNGQDLTNVGLIDVQIIDDEPVATDQSAPSSIAEANIPIIGSNQQVTPNTLTGTLIIPSIQATPPGPGDLSNNRFGANGGTVSNVTVVGGGTVITPTTITVQDVQTNTLVVDTATGDYTYTLNGPFHNTNNQPYNEIFTYTFKDNEGQTSSANLTITILDDAPIANNITASSVYEAGLASGTQPGSGSAPVTATGFLFAQGAGNGGDVNGADGPGNPNVTALSLISVTNTAGVSASISSSLITLGNGHQGIEATDTLGNVLTIDEVTGQYTYTLNSPFHNTTPDTPVIETFSYQITDGDGSTSSAQIAIAINDDAPKANAINTAAVFESGLATGSQAGITAVTATGLLFSAGTNNGGDLYGADGAGSITTLTFTSVSNTSGVNAGISSKTITIGADAGIEATDSLGNSLKIDQVTGVYTYTLTAPFHNTVANSPVTEVFTYQIKDGDGSTSSNHITVTINDDTTIAVVQSISAPAQFSSKTGNIFTLTGNSAGADGVGSASISTSNVNYTVTTTGTTITIADPQADSFEVTIANGNYIYTYNNGNSSGSMTINYTLIDSDGSSETNTLNLTGLFQTAPVVLDLVGEGIHLLSPEQSSMTFNHIFQNGDERKIGWIAEGEGLLMLNKNGDGTFTSLDQIAFVSYLSGAKTDLEGLAAFDTNHDNKLDAQDNDFAQFGVLLADNSFQTLSELGIASISLVSDHQQTIMNTNKVFGFSHYETNDGKQHAVADVMLTVGANNTTLNDQDVLVENNEIDFSQFSVMTKDDQVWVKDNDVIIQNELIIESLSPQVLTNILMNDHQQTMQGMMLHHQLELVPG